MDLDGNKEARAVFKKYNMEVLWQMTEKEPKTRRGGGGAWKPHIPISNDKGPMTSTVRTIIETLMEKVFLNCFY